MINHVCIAVRSEENAENVFQRLFQMQELYRFHIDAETTRTLFGISSSLEARVYDAGNCRIEVFITGDAVPPPGFRHVCVETKDRRELEKRAEKLGFTIRRHKRPRGRDVVFVVDADGNLFEIKEPAPVK